MAIEFIRPKDLPAAAEVNPNDDLIVDNGASVGRATPKQIVDAGRPGATEQQAVAGTDNDVAMTPLTTAQAIAADGAGIKSDAQAALQGAQTAQGLAEDARDSAQGYASAAGGSASAAAGSASGASSSASAALASAGNAASSESAASQAASAAVTAQGLAEAWAESPTAPGDPGTKSAKTWAEEAEASADRLPKTPMDFGAIGDGVADDTAAIRGANSNTFDTRLINKDYGLATTTIANATAITGPGTLRRKSDGTLLGATGNGHTLRDLTLDLDRTSLGPLGGHGFSVNGDNNIADNVIVTDYGSNDGGGGSSIRFGSGKLNRISNLQSFADPAADINIGWLYSGVNYSTVNMAYSYGVQSGIGYAHELKNESSYNVLVGLMTEASKLGLVYGQQGGVGPNHNMAVGVVSGSTDRAFYTGFSDDNMVVGLLADTTDRPELTSIRLVSLSGSDRNAVHASHISGPATSGDILVDIAGNDNYVGASLHSAGNIRFNAGSETNFVEIHHPGQRQDVQSSVVDNSGQPISGSSANVVHSPATGERLGSVSGKFTDRLATSGSVPSSAHQWIRDSDQFNLEAILCRGDSGDIAGETIYGRNGDTQGRMWYSFGATAADDQYRMGVGGEHDLFTLGTVRATFARPVRLPSYTVATAPAAAFETATGSVIYVSDGDAGNPCLAVSNGTSWLRVSLGAAISAT